MMADSSTSLASRFVLLAIVGIIGVGLLMLVVARGVGVGAVAVARGGEARE